ncbi:cytochrome c3 family protein, partial [Desulfovibrio sp. OttesenSCG-928-C06]|nr:cytochrome c3 family protein [Desulfovibrio sp. OttesenSCG-928-C06]
MKVEKRNSQTMRRLLFLSSLLVALCLLPGYALAEPEFKDGVAPGDCAPCHEGDKMVGPDHPATSGMSWDDCAACHNSGKDGAKTLNMRLPAGHIHMLAGQDCSICHEDGNTENLPDIYTCQGCHADYVEKTPPRDGLDNPHENHLGQPDC